MSDPAEIWAIIPVKETQDAKQRLAAILSAPLRQALALAMLEDVLVAVAGIKGLGGAILVTADAQAMALARRYGATTIADGAHNGHIGAVNAGARHLVAQGRGTMLTLPGDLPLVTAAEIETLIAAHGLAPAFTIAPAHDDLGSNAILMSPPQAVPLRFGADSFFPTSPPLARQGSSHASCACRGSPSISTIRKTSIILHGSDRQHVQVGLSQRTPSRSVGPRRR